MDESTTMPERTDPRLRPRRITLESNLKIFSLESGISSGSSVAIEYFDAPEDADPTWVREQIWREKERLDLMALTMEYARGSTSREDYDLMRQRLRQSYDHLLKRNPKNES